MAHPGRRTFLLSGAALVAAMPYAPFRAEAAAIYPDPVHFLDIRDGQLDDTGLSNLESTFGALSREIGGAGGTPGKPLVIHFHGGLRTRNQAVDVLRFVDATYESAGVWPYFFLYNVGLLPSLAGGYAERGLFSLYDNQAPSISRRLSAPAQLNARRFTNGRDHGGMTDLEDRMRVGFPLMNLVGYYGPLSWAYMKQSIRDGLDVPKVGSSGPFGSCDPWPHLRPGRYDCTRAGGALFLQHLRDALEERTFIPSRIVLVGHSAGAIYANEFLRKAHAILTTSRTRHLQFDVIFLAPAVTYQDFERMWRETGGARIRNLRVFLMKDEAEQADAVIPKPRILPRRDFYSRSLLYLVSGVFERAPDEPLLGLARFLDPAVLARINDDPSQVSSIDYVQSELARHFGGLGNVFIQTPTPPTAPLGRLSLATDHMAFAEDAQSRTIDSVAYLASQDHWT